MRYMYSRRSLENTCDTCIVRNTSSRYIAIQYRNTYSAYVLRRTALCTAAHEGMGLRRVRGQHRRVCVRLQGLQGLLYGICSHLLAINHILKHFNVRYQLHGIGTSNRSKSGPGQGRLPNPEPALQRARIAREPDSSDEEQERVLELGRQGKRRAITIRNTRVFSCIEKRIAAYCCLLIHVFTCIAMYCRTIHVLCRTIHVLNCKDRNTCI